MCDGDGRSNPRPFQTSPSRATVETPQSSCDYNSLPTTQKTPRRDSCKFIVDDICGYILDVARYSKSLRQLLPTLQHKYYPDVLVGHESDNAARSPAASLGTDPGYDQSSFQIAGSLHDHDGYHRLAVARYTEARARTQAGFDAPGQFHPWAARPLWRRCGEW